MISFRLTDEEYDRFRKLCQSRGLRNVSELVRTALNSLLDERPELDRFDTESKNGRIAQVEARVAYLCTAVFEIETRLNGLLMGAPVETSTSKDAKEGDVLT